MSGSAEKFTAVYTNIPGIFCWVPLPAGKVDPQESANNDATDAAADAMTCLQHRLLTTCVVAEHQLSRASYAASEGRPASSTDGHSESANHSMGYWDTNGVAEEHSPPRAHSLGNELLYGLINTIVSIPAMISFAAIIFQVCPRLTMRCRLLPTALAERMRNDHGCPQCACT